MKNPVNATNIGDVRRFAKKLAKSKKVERADIAAVVFLNRYGGFYRFSNGGDFEDERNQLSFVRSNYSKKYDGLLRGRPQGGAVRFMTKRIESTLMLSKFSNSGMKGFRIVRNKQ